MPVSSNVRHRRTAAMATRPSMNRQACARLEYTHTACGRVRRASVRHCCKKLVAHFRHKATVGSTQSAGQRSVMQERGGTETPITLCPAKAPSPSHGGRATGLQLHPIGKHNESANCSPGRQELQGNSVHSHINNTDTHSFGVLGLAKNWWVVARLHTRSRSKIKTALPNHSLNRTFCGSPGLGFISFSPKPGLPQNAG